MVVILRTSTCVITVVLNAAWTYSRIHLWGLALEQAKDMPTSSHRYLDYSTLACPQADDARVTEIEAPKTRSAKQAEGPRFQLTPAGGTKKRQAEAAKDAAQAQPAKRARPTDDERVALVWRLLCRVRAYRGASYLPFPFDKGVYWTSH